MSGATARRMHLKIEASDTDAFSAVSDKDAQIYRLLTQRHNDSFTGLLIRAAAARTIVVLDRAGMSREQRVLEVLADLHTGTVDLQPMAAADRELIERLHCSGPFPDWIRSVLWSGVSVVIRTDLPTIE